MQPYIVCMRHTNTVLHCQSNANKINARKCLVCRPRTTSTQLMPVSLFFILASEYRVIFSYVYV